VTETPSIRGEAVLRDYPLRIWARQQEHTESLLREFQLLLVGEGSDRAHHAPRQLVELADMFTRRFGPLIEAINSERSAALEQGLDRMDSRVPLLEGLPDLIAQVEAVLAAVDEYCAAGDLLVLPRSEELLRFAQWTYTELRRQYEGGEPQPWPGPF
jgi:hypothetical protein